MIILYIIFIDWKGNGYEIFKMQFAFDAVDDYGLDLFGDGRCKSSGTGFF